jgi:hypothetical protein
MDGVKYLEIDHPRYEIHMILEHERNVEIVLVDGYNHKDHFGKMNYAQNNYKI